MKRSLPFSPTGCKGRALTLALPLGLLLTACGATPLAAKFAPSAASSEALVVENISQAESRSEHPVVVALRADAPLLAAWDLTGKLLWELPVQALSAPLVAGDAVLVQEAAGVVVRDLARGKTRLVVRSEGSLVGADGNGSSLVLSFALQDDSGGGHGELVFVTGDSIRWEKALSQPGGTPALVRNQVLAPWGTQRLSVLSADDGTELARFAFTNMVVGHALVDRGHVYIGQHGLLRVDSRLPDRQAGPLVLSGPQKRALPGQPAVLRDGYAKLPAPDNASHKIKLDWRTSAGEAGGVAADAALFRFYRMAFGLSAAQDDVRWVRSFEHDLVGSSMQPEGGALLVDARGTLRQLDAQGVTRTKIELGKPLRVATIRAGELLVEGEQELEVPAGSLHDQLLAAAQLSDDRLHPARAFAIQYLARMSDPSITRELIALCSRKGQGSYSAQLSACEELSKREGSAEDILAGLRQKASFLEDTSAPPVGSLARAAARMQLKQAGPLIISHIEDPHTAASDLAALFQALEVLELQSAVPQLERFVRLHHAEPEGTDLGPALASAISVLGKLRAVTVRGTLERIAADNLTVAPVRQQAKEALAQLDLPLPKHEAPKPAPAPAKAKQAVAAPEVQTDPRPYALGRDEVQKAFRPLQAGLEQCLANDPAQPKSLRIAMIVAGDGRMEGFVVTPTSLQGCTDALVRTAQFPATRLARQHVHQTVYAKPAP